MTAREQALLLVAIASLQMACDPGQGPNTGLTEPMQTSGQFITGDLPGSPPLALDAGSAMAGDGGAEGSTPLTVRSVTFQTSQIQPGADNQSLGGFVTSDAVAVGMRLQDLGSGYWVVPVGAVDPSDPTEESFGTVAGFETTIPAGVHDLLFVAIDGSGNGGRQYATPFCFENPIPDNGHACNKDQQPYAAVFTLQWDANFELDLHVVAPDGKEFSPENPYGMEVDAGVHGIDPTLPHIDSVGLRNCVPSGLRQEDLIFPTELPGGTYTIYVDPYAACGQAATVFTFSVYRSSGTCPDCNFTQVGTSVSGEVLASQVTGGILSPLKIDQVRVAP